MRINHPVSQKEYDYPAHLMLVSSTNSKGEITHCNKAFVEVSGFTYDELIGQPHNLVRHPDMPPEAYRDMWRTIGSGLPWTGMVKNRRKNGDHYWVQANVTPIMDNGKPSGYMSVRTKPSSQQIQAAEALYAHMQAGDSGIRLHQGHVQRSGVMGWLDRWSRSTATFRLGMLLLLTLSLSLTSLLFVSEHLAVILESGTMVLGSALILWWFSANVDRPLREAGVLARDVAACNLTQGLQPSGPEPIASLIRSLTQIQVNLRAVVGDVRHEVEGFSQAAEEIAGASLDLSQRTETQASSLQETAASMEQLSATVRHTSDNADSVATQTQRSVGIASDGQGAIQTVSGSMQAIERSSSQIADIIGVIDSIAFQTNILALNAAVEAARAGEQGRGFAVVAGEVRALAQRSAAAAKEIKDLIQTSVQQVNVGVNQMKGASGTMNEIVREIRTTQSVVEEIRHATHEQANGLAQINTAIVHLDNVTQQNAAMVEQASAAADNLRAGCQELKLSVAVFRV